MSKTNTKQGNPGDTVFELRGPMGDYDPRTTPIRGDLADIKLAGHLFAPHYVEPQLKICTAITTQVRSLPNANDVSVSQLIYGERFAVLDISGGWAWGYSCHDEYLGYVRTSDLGDPVDATHMVAARGALIFSDPDIKSAVLKRLPMGAQIICDDVESENDAGQFMSCDNGFVHLRHIAPVGEAEGDSVALARQLTGAPYLWGGRSGDGLDCSGLVQMVLGLQGMECPRDSDQQMSALGTDIAENAQLQSGDIIFFPGHVGIMTDDETLIHANAHWMQVVEEPLADVIARFPDDVEQPVLARKRLAQ